jgi:hypothetical protein
MHPDRLHPDRLHPDRLHAQTALWRLRKSWPALWAEADALASADTPDGLRSWAPGRGGRGAASSRGLDALVTRPSDPGGHQRAAARVGAAIRWLAERLQLPADGRELVTLTERLPSLPEGVCGPLTAHLTEADDLARRVLRWPGSLDLARLPDNPRCPGCSRRYLRVQASAPDRAVWTIVCVLGCRCLGAPCRCCMPVRPEGAVHVWTLDTLRLARRAARGRRAP